VAEAFGKQAVLRVNFTACFAHELYTCPIAIARPRRAIIRCTADQLLSSTMRPPRLDQLDDLDRNLVALLQANARESVASLARELGVARTTVISRIARLERSNVIAGYSVRLGQDVLDSSIVAYVGIIIGPKHGPAVQRRLGKMPEVQLLCAVSGEFDYVAWLRADSPDRLNDLLDQIGGMEGVERTTTSIILARKIDRGMM